jgi:hypothetical protein
MLPLSAVETQRIALVVAQNLRTATESVMRKTILLLTTLAAGFAAPGARAAAQQVQGQVVDSTTGEALRGAVVYLMDADGWIVASTLTDADGLFLMRAPGPNRYGLRAEFEGYRHSSFPPFQLLADQSVSYRLRLPALSAQSSSGEDLRALASAACPNVPRGERIVLGWVHDSKTQAPIADASVLVSWSHVPDALRGSVDVGYFEGITTTDSSGFYAICGAPATSMIGIHALRDQGMSGFYQLRFVDGGVIAGGEVFGTTGRAWRQDLAIMDPAERTTELIGTVTDSTTGTPLAEAQVELVGTPLVAETDGTGNFRIGQLPPGPIRLRVRRVGSLPLEQVVVLPATGVLQIPNEALALARAPTELEPVVVETVVGRSPFAEFTARREKGVGSFVTRDQFMRQGNPNRASDVLRNMAGVNIRRGPDMNMPWIVTLTRGGPRTFGNAVGGATGSGGCPPLYFLDRHYIGTAHDTDVDAAVPLNDIEAIEVHPSVASLPHDFNRIGAQCGVIAFWSRYADPDITAQVTDGGGIMSSPFLHFGIALGLVAAIFFGLGQTVNF